MIKTLYVGYYQPIPDEYIVVVTFDREEALEKTEDSQWDLDPRLRPSSRHFVLGYDIDVDPDDTPQKAYEKLQSIPREELGEESFYREISVPVRHKKK